MMQSEQLQKHLDGLWTVKDLSRYFGVTPMTISLWRRHKDLPAVVIPGDALPAIRFVPVEVRRWARQNRVHVAHTKQ